MRITDYIAVLDKDDRTLLVKEKSTNYPKYNSLDEPCKIANLMCDLYKMHEQAVEYMYMIALNSKNKVIGVYQVSKGGANFSYFSAREIYMTALLLGAVSIIVIHNHPSGDCTPSKEDISVTKKLAEAGELVGINFLDHIVVSKDKYLSLKETQLF